MTHGDAGHAAAAADVAARGRQPARRRDVPGRGPARAGRHPAAAQPRQRDQHDPGQAGRRWSRRSPTGRSCARPGGSSRCTPWRTCRTTWSSSRRRSPPAAGSCTGRATRPRPTRSWSTWSGPRASTRWSRSSPWPPRRSALNEALEAAGIAALETDLAELIVQLGHDKPSHILVPAIHRNRAEIREIFLREMGDVDPELTDEPAALAGAARQHLRRKFLSAKVAISGANFGVAETGTLCGGGVRGQRPDVPDPARDLDHDHGDREAGAALAGPRGLPAAVATLLDRASG